MDHEKQDVNPIGRASIDGNITLIERAYIQGNTKDHETGHLLGLGHTEGTFMREKNSRSNNIITNEQRGQYLIGISMKAAIFVTLIETHLVRVTQRKIYKKLYVFGE